MRKIVILSIKSYVWLACKYWSLFATTWQFKENYVYDPLKTLQMLSKRVINFRLMGDYKGINHIF